MTELWTIEHYNDWYDVGQWEPVLDHGLFKSEEAAQAYVDKLNQERVDQEAEYKRAQTLATADYEAEKAKLREAGFSSSLARRREVYKGSYVSADRYSVGEAVEVNE